MSTGGRIAWANSLRGVAALSVVVAWHYTGLFFLTSDDAGPPSLEIQFYRWIHVIDWGAIGVGLFFLLSGLVIARSLTTMSPAGFALNRALRLLPTYAAGYLVISVVHWMSLHHQDREYPFETWTIAVGMVPGLDRLLRVPSLQNGVVWTLLVEIFFYILCIILFRRIHREWWVAPTTSVLLTGLALGLSALQGGNAPDSTLSAAVDILVRSIPYIPILLIGVTLTVQSRFPGSSARLTCVIGLHLAAFLIMWFRIRPNALPLPDAHAWTFAITAILFVMAWRLWTRWQTNPITDFFADISYPLYVLHLPIALSLAPILGTAGLGATMTMVVLLASTAAMAFAVHIWVEVPTHRLGRRWSRKLSAQETGHTDCEPAPGPPINASTRRRPPMSTGRPPT